MRASSTCPRVEPSGVIPPPSSTGDTTSEEPIDHAADADAAADVPPPSTSNDSNIRCMLETVMTI